ncbi:MAG: PKD domain-containing protein [Bacteroidia bacterium]
MRPALLSLLGIFLCLAVNATTIPSTSCTISGDTVVCENEVQSYTSGYSGTYTYQWGAFGGSISGSNTKPSVTVNWGFVGTGQVTVIIKDSLNTVVCTQVLNITIYPSPIPEIVPSQEADCRHKDGPGGQPDEGGTECLTACDSTWINYSTTLNPGSTYTWTITGSSTYTISGNEVDVFWEGPGVGTVKVVETNMYGCVGEHEICVEIIERPNAAFSTLPAATSGVITICLNQDVYFFNESTQAGGTAITSYEWIFGDGNTDYFTPPDSGHTSHSYSTPNTYTVQLVVTNECGCTDTAELTIIVESLPGPNIECISTVCPGATMTYSTDASCSSYNWTATNGTIVGSSTGPTVTVQWSGTAPAILTLDVDPCPGYCPNPTSIVVPLIPAAASIAGDTVVCENTCNTYKISCDIPVDSIVWHIPPGISFFGDTINVHEIQICAGFGSFSGTIWVEYFHKTNGSTQGLDCGGNAYLPYHVRPSMSIFGSSVYCENESFSFVVPGSTGNINWEITDNTGTTIYSMVTLPISSPFTGAWFWGPGTFLVTATDLSNNFCQEEVQKIITVHEAPPPPIISGPDSVCPNSTHNYSATMSNAGHTVSWNVVGGSPSTAIGSSVNITWNSTGPYIIYAFEVDPITLCKSVADTLVVQSLLPLAAATFNGPDTVCSNSTVSYSTSSPGDTYFWSINGSLMGSVAAGQHSSGIDVQFNNVTGTAWLVLERSLCSQIKKDSILITIIPAPTPSMTIPATVCQQETFTASTSTSALSYSWDFGDGNSETGSSTTHDYDSSGSYVVTLTVTYGGNCPATVSTTQTIVVNPSPITNISTGDETLYCNPATISTTMTISTSVTSTGCNWYKSPSSTSISTASSYTATSIGTYYVVCSNSYGCSDTSNFITIDTTSCDDTCRPQNYTLDFDIFRLGCNTDSFEYSSSNVSSHSWDFGDFYNPGSNSASGNNVTHTYTEPGIYVVTLCGLVPNMNSSLPDCQVCIKKSDTIDYVPDFYPIINCTDYSSSFTVTFNNSTKVYTLAPSPSYSWKINGGSVLSTATDFTTSLAAGTYNVELIINGVCNLVKTITIDSIAQANFYAADSICVGAPIVFSNTTTGSYSSSEWDFGDGASSLINSPVRAYDVGGSYNVSLTIVNEFGCKDSIVKSIYVLPNTLNASISLSGPNEFCFGDSVILTANPTGGYPSYTYLWTTTSTAQSITSYYTGNYGVQVWDAKQCYTQVPDTVVKVNPLPNAVIIGPNSGCQYQNQEFKVPVPTSGHTINWYINGTLSSTTNTLNYFPFTAGTDMIHVDVTNSYGCSKSDTLFFTTYPNPNVTTTSEGTLCEGDTTLLIAKSTSTNLVSMMWSNGQTNDSIYVTNPGIYIVTVVDSNGCTAQSAVLIHELPDMCGLMTGCYEICDTVTELVWYAPKGYFSYQWFYNGVAMSGSTSDTVHIPLHQSGTYQVLIMNADSCSTMSDPIDITFVSCGGCEISGHTEIECGPFDHHGDQTYNVTFTINSNLPNGSNIAISSSQGQVLGLSSSTVNNGSNVLTATFIDQGAIDTIVCFNVAVWDSTQRCDTIICDTLPNCECSGEGTNIVSQEHFDCIGHDSLGNPQYYGCVNVWWGGSGSSSMTLAEPSSGFSPSAFSINPGPNVICFTYTDYPPINPGAVLIYAYFYDSTTMTTCKDSFRIVYDPCPDVCELDVVGLCAHCDSTIQGGVWVYKLEMAVNNPFGGNANVSITPISAGTFGAITPNPIPPGSTTITVPFTDWSPTDSIICFKITLTEVAGHGICHKDLCIALPDCKGLSVNEMELQTGALISIYPNPSSDVIYVRFNQNVSNASYSLQLTNMLGKEVKRSNRLSKNNVLFIKDLSKGVYTANIIHNGDIIGSKKIVIQ